MIQIIRGFKDILPGEIECWQYIEKTAIALFEDFGFQEIRIPLLEKTELFARSIGEDTDIVEKEMYTFPDRKGDLITLRPEATASIVRAYVQHKMYATDPVRKFYMTGPMFRRERPQKGRYRQFYQIDAEILGVAEPLADAQLIIMLVTLLDRLAIEDVKTHINSLGCPQCRPAFKEALTAFIETQTAHLCADCLRRRSRNPLRVLDCKVPKCRDAMADAPLLVDHLCSACKDHFDTVRQALADQRIDYVIDKRLVRGLDYYTRTTFEIQTGSLGAQSAIAGGGRYDGLIEALGGPSMPAIGFAIGFDRLAELMAAQAIKRRTPDLFIAALGAEAQTQAFNWSCELAQAGLLVETDMADRSLKSQMKRADRLGAAYTLIVGENELATGQAALRNMHTKNQTDLPLAEMVTALKRKLADR